MVLVENGSVRRGLPADGLRNGLTGIARQFLRIRTVDGKHRQQIASERKRVRIAILGSRGIPNTYGGYETIAQELATGLCQKGFDVYVSCETKGGPYALAYSRTS